ncbi:MAG: DUF3379 domain-containing protein [Gammaproteobacteria bacterium]|nr:DUF3379 domain-containing protein [Gammaproteobacteria bacterium]
MDDLEFRKNAVIEPGNQDPEFLKKAKQTPNNHRFVEKQQAFNKTLQSTLEISTPENLADRIILAQQLTQHKLHQTQKRQKQWRNWLGGSIAASLIIALSLQMILPTTFNSTALAQEVVNHVKNDTHALDVQMNVPKTRIDSMLASYGGRLNGPIGKVSFLGHCIIGEHTGIHMVINTSEGVVTVLLLPTQKVDKVSLLKESQLSGILYPSLKGSIAIISEQAEAIEETRQHIDQNLNWII